MKYEHLTLDQFRTFAQNLALGYQNKRAVIGLIGALGAGKTTLVKAFAESLGVKHAKSPSFVVIHQYDTSNLPFYHIDFYRLEQSKQLSPLGIDEILAGPNLVLIEWVDKFPQIARRCDVIIHIEINPDQTRRVTIKQN